MITREATRDFERNFARWATALRKVSTEGDLDAFVQKSFGPAKAGLSLRFDDAFRRLNFDAVQLYRLRYILAKITQYVDLQGFGETEGTKWLSRYTSNGFEIEHIYPQTPTKDAEQEFGAATDIHVADRLGNLVLVEKSINASLGNSAFSQKRAVYLQSQLLLTRALAERPKVGVNTKIDAAVDRIEPFATWNEEGVARRQEMLAGIARVVWRLPTAPGS